MTNLDYQVAVSVENQETANARIPQLLHTRAALRVLICKPLIGPLDLTHIISGPDAGAGWTYRHWNALTGDNWCDCEDFIQPEGTAPLDLVVICGESSPHAYPMRTQWVGALVEQLTEAGVAVFVKQLPCPTLTEEL